jgi:8-oxo-dGTP pyrophosphatase MutT (NUDIX family)
MSKKQFAALPYRMRGAQLDILLVTTRGKRHWSVPKGWPIKGEKPHFTARLEAYEEAGVIGKVKANSIGRYKHTKQKKGRKIKCDVSLFPLEVHQQRRSWPERGERDAIWLPADSAATMVRDSHLSRLIQCFAQQGKQT